MNQSTNSQVSLKTDKHRLCYHHDCSGLSNMDRKCASLSVSNVLTVDQYKDNRGVKRKEIGEEEGDEEMICEKANGNELVVKYETLTIVDTMSTCVKIEKFTRSEMKREISNALTRIDRYRSQKKLASLIRRQRFTTKCFISYSPSSPMNISPVSESHLVGSNRTSSYVESFKSPNELLISPFFTRTKDVSSYTDEDAMYADVMSTKLKLIDCYNDEVEDINHRIVDDQYRGASYVDDEREDKVEQYQRKADLVAKAKKLLVASNGVSVSCCPSKRSPAIAEPLYTFGPSTISKLYDYQSLQSIDFDTLFGSQDIVDND